jgi:hypothetical protein
MSTLKDNIGAVLREFGAPIVVALKPVLDSLIASTKDWSIAAAKIGEKVAGFISFGKDTIDAMVSGSLRVSEVLSGAFQVASLAFQEYMSKAITFVVELLIGVFSNGEMWAAAGKAMINGLTASMLYLVDDIMSGFQNSAKSTAESMAEVMSDALSNVDFAPSASLKDAAESFRAMIDESIAKSSIATPGQTSEASAYDAELAEQRKRNAAMASGMAQNAPALWGKGNSSIPNRLDRNDQFDGLHSAQRKYATIGQNNIFARDRSRLGIASGLQTGGLGAVRAIGQRRDANQKQETLAEKQLTATEEVAKNIKQALTVG